MSKRIVVLCLIIALDAVGVGLIYPMLPELLRALVGSAEVSITYGAIVALHAFMQFVFSPVMGALSDRFGRRPVLLVSIVGATIDYAIMGRSASVVVLLVGRAIAGLTSANLAVAMAYVTDITGEGERAARIGYLQAAFGVGIFLGPILGGSVGTLGIRMPFLAAASLNGLTFALAYFGLPESRRGSSGQVRTTLNPLGHVRWAIGASALVPLLVLHFLMGIVGNLSSTVWVLYGHDRFWWDSRTTGYSLALLGLCHAAAQALLTGPITERFGDRKTVYAGIVCDVLAMVALGIATRGWMAFALAPLFALGALGLPALQSLTTRQVSEERQGELQGVVASVGSLTAVVGPLVASIVYSSTKAWWMGGVWVAGAALYIFCVPVFNSRALRTSTVAAA
jgi:MFS transporter, DHA1 family, tetracycline resistance protein